MAEATITTSGADDALYPVAAGVDQDATFLALSRALRRANGFTLLIAVCNEPVRQQRLLDRFDETLPAPALRVSVPADCCDALAVVESVLHGESVPQAVMVTGFASGIRSSDPSRDKLRALNHRREEWRDCAQAPVVFWVPEYLLQPLAQQAPDFLDWRSGTFLFLDPLGRPATTAAPDHTLEVWRLTADQRRQRMVQLRDWLVTAPLLQDGQPDPAAIRWRLELADHHQRLGEFDECLQLARDVLSLVPADDERNLAFAWSLIADVLQARGELDEALRIRREEELPVYERLGDVREKAVTQGQIADVLESRAELDEALRIRREEELPVYERLGDVRGMAVTQGKIADVLHARGELDEALRIRREEQLPVYERLGDVRGKAITQGQIADVLQAKGELDEALRIRREEELPVYERLGDVRATLLVRLNVERLRAEKGEIREAVTALRELLPRAEELGDAHLRIWFYEGLANLYFQRNEGRDRQGRCLDYLQKALGLAEKMQLPGEIKHLKAALKSVKQKKWESRWK